MMYHLGNATKAAFSKELDPDTMNIAHVFPCGKMKDFIDGIKTHWNKANMNKLYSFVNWLFAIDTEAVVQGKYLTGNANNRISFKGKHFSMAIEQGTL